MVYISPHKRSARKLGLGRSPRPSASTPTHRLTAEPWGRGDLIRRSRWDSRARSTTAWIRPDNLVGAPPQHPKVVGDPALGAQRAHCLEEVVGGRRRRRAWRSAREPCRRRGSDLVERIEQHSDAARRKLARERPPRLRCRFLPVEARTSGRRKTIVNKWEKDM